MRITPIALSGLHDARARADRAARDIVEAGARGRPTEPAPRASNAPVSTRLSRPLPPDTVLVEAAVDLKTARAAFAAAARLLKTADELDRTLIEASGPDRSRRRA